MYEKKCLWRHELNKWLPFLRRIISRLLTTSRRLKISCIVRSVRLPIESPNPFSFCLSVSLCFPVVVPPVDGQVPDPRHARVVGQPQRERPHDQPEVDVQHWKQMPTENDSYWYLRKISFFCETYSAMSRGANQQMFYVNYVLSLWWCWKRKGENQIKVWIMNRKWQNHSQFSPHYIRSI